MELQFQIDTRSTHDNSNDFKESLDDNQREFLDFLLYVVSHPDDEQTAVYHIMINDLINIWDSNEEIHHVVAAVANDYWRQFAYYRQPFQFVHFGQQLHILACLYNLVRSYINEHNMVKRGDLNHNDLPIYSSKTGFSNEN